MDGVWNWTDGVWLAHPGITLRKEVMEPLLLTVSDAAEKLSVSRNAFSRVLNGHAAVSALNWPSGSRPRASVPRNSGPRCSASTTWRRPGK